VEVIMPVDQVTSPFAYFDTSLELPEYFPLNTGVAAVFSTRAPGKQTANEDALALVPVSDSSLVLAVADGMGGLPAGEEASRTVIKRLIKSLTRVSREDMSVREAILDGIEQANDELLGCRNGCGTTLVVAELQGNILRTYHAGDSVIMLMGNRGKIKYTAIAHSPTGYALEAGIIDETEAMSHEHRHLISNYIGSADMRLEIGPNIEISPRDTLLLASDGLSDNLYDDEIVEICRKGPLRTASQKLAFECMKCMVQPVANRGHHPDDLTFIMFRSSISR
jgi:serine/threonine protein phosphatase PrpC